MTWKNTIRKEISDKDMKEMIEEEEAEREADEDWNKPFGSDNTVIRDRDDYFDPNVREKMKLFNDIGTHTIREMLGELHDFLENTMPPIKKIVNEKVLREQIELAIGFLERRDR